MSAGAIPDGQEIATACLLGLQGDVRYAPEAAYLKTLAPFSDLEPDEIRDFLLRISPSVLRPQEFPFTLAWLTKPHSLPHDKLAAGLEMARGWPEAFYAAVGRLDESSSGWTSPSWTIKLVKTMEAWVAKKVQVGRGLIIAEAIRAYRVGCQLTPGLPPFTHMRTRRK